MSAGGSAASSRNIWYSDDPGGVVRAHGSSRVPLPAMSAPFTLLERRIPPMQDEDVSVRILDEPHVADAGVLDTDHFGANRSDLVDRQCDVRDTQRNAALVRNEFLPVLFRCPEVEGDVRGLDLALHELALGKPEHV